MTTKPKWFHHLCLAIVVPALVGACKDTAVGVHSSPAAPSPTTNAARTDCESGYEWRDGACMDIDECGGVATPCGTPLANCTNKQGGYECTCPVGYSGGGPLGIGCSPRLVAGLAATCFLSKSSDVRCWGAENAGFNPQDTPLKPSAEPQPILGAERTVSLAMGSNHACLLRSDATVACWGSNAEHQLGAAQGTFEPAPRAVPGLQHVVSIQAAGGSTCAVQRGGVVSCWGQNYAGQLGLDPSNLPVSPTTVSIPPVVQVAVGTSYACGLHADGTAHCWGGNRRGQLGAGGAAPPTAVPPTQVVGLTGATMLAAGGDATAALLQSGQVVWWGTSQADNETKNAVGRLTTVGITSMRQVTSAVAVDAHNDTVCALSRDGSVYCQGTAPLGDGKLLDSLEAVRVQLESRAIALSLCTHQHCVLLADGSVACWGSQGYKLHGDFKGDWIMLPRVLSGIRVPL